MSLAFSHIALDVLVVRPLLRNLDIYSKQNLATITLVQKTIARACYLKDALQPMRIRASSQRIWLGIKLLGRQTKPSTRIATNHDRVDVIFRGAWHPSLQHVANPQQALRDACASQDMAGMGGLLRLPDLHSTSCMVCLSLWRKLPLLFLWLSTSVFMFGMFWPGLRWHLFLTVLCPVGHISYDNTLPSPQCFFKFFQEVHHVFCIFLVQPLMQIRPHFPILSRSPVWCSMGVADDSNFDFSSPSRCLMSPLWPHHRFLGLYPGYTPAGAFLV